MDMQKAKMLAKELVAQMTVEENLDMGAFALGGKDLDETFGLIETAEKAAEILKFEMENAAKLSVPMEADVGIGKTWLLAH